MQNSQWKHSFNAEHGAPIRTEKAEQAGEWNEIATCSETKLVKNSLVENKQFAYFQWEWVYLGQIYQKILIEIQHFAKRTVRLSE